MLQRFDLMNDISAQTENLKKELVTRYEEFDANELRSGLLQKYSELSKRNKIILGFAIVGAVATVGTAVAVISKKRQELEEVFMGTTCTCKNCDNCKCDNCTCSDCKCNDSEETTVKNEETVQSESLPAVE